MPSQAQWLLFHNSLRSADYRALRCDSSKNSFFFFSIYRNSTLFGKLSPQNQHIYKVTLSFGDSRKESKAQKKSHKLKNKQTNMFNQNL